MSRSGIDFKKVHRRTEQSRWLLTLDNARRKIEIQDGH